MSTLGTALRRVAENHVLHATPEPAHRPSALVTGLILTLVLDLDEIVYALSGILWVFLMLSILFKPV